MQSVFFCLLFRKGHVSILHINRSFPKISQENTEGKEESYSFKQDIKELFANSFDFFSNSIFLNLKILLQRSTEKKITLTSDNFKMKFPAGVLKKFVLKKKNDPSIKD